MTRFKFLMQWQIFVWGLLFLCPLHADQKQVEERLPDALKGWVDWVVWDTPNAPAIYNEPHQRIALWPSQLALSVDEKKGAFQMAMQVFESTWVPLPGGHKIWPLEVTSNGMTIPVLMHKGRPSVFLERGEWDITGQFLWDRMPQYLSIPPTVGILELQKNGEVVVSPNWDTSGRLWLKRTSRESTDKNYLAAKVYRNLADGSPMWLYTDIELTVSGKSREEVLGAIVPEGWKISSLKAAIPCAIDDQGILKAQVRAGKWIISLSAFRTTPLTMMRYSDSVNPMVHEELIALKNKENFRLIEFRDIPAMDAAQTTFPSKWRNYPLYLWDNKKPFTLVETMRGIGSKQPAGLSISRSFWLDENGKTMTYRDAIHGGPLQIWRLDAAEGQQLGAAKIGSESQLITYNPTNGAKGVEIRTRNLNLQAVGRMDNSQTISATGWRADAERLSAELFLPPGWRAFAIWGADASYGDWVSRWSLLDVFFLLMFTVVIFKVTGRKLSAVALIAFLLTYHEPDVPRFLWVFFLALLVLYRMIVKLKIRRVLLLMMYGVCIFLGLELVSFSYKQIQQSIYPQLESHTIVGTRDWGRSHQEEVLSLSSPNSRIRSLQLEEGVSFTDYDDFAVEKGKDKKRAFKKGYAKFNMQQTSKAKIQTGPAVPEWHWRSVFFDWSGPVSEEERVHLLLIPRWLQSIITPIGVVLLWCLFCGLMRQMKKSQLAPSKGLFKATKHAAVMLLTGMCVWSGGFTKAQAQFPDQQLLEQLKARILEEPAKTHQYAEIPRVDITLQGRDIEMEVQVHTAKQTIVPLPGSLSSWSPVSVLLENGTSLPICRHQGFLWVVLEQGTHKVVVKGMVPAGDWEWSFRLKPKYVSVQAPGWTVTGVDENGVPENQIFFVEQNKSQVSEVDYDRNDFYPVFQVRRSLELGLIWGANTTVRRLSPLGKAVSISIPLLPGERVLSTGVTVENDRALIRLGAQQRQISWSSQITQSSELELKAEPSDQWVEEWTVIASTVWNLSLEGLTPMYQVGASNMTPVWQPWPGESTKLHITRPKGIDGPTLTIRQAIHKMQLGARQRTSSLKLALQTSLGTDFVIGLADQVEVTSVKLNSIETPVRKEGGKVIVSLRPGEQVIELNWKTPIGIQFSSWSDEVKLPVECANTSTIMSVSPQQRWVLWADGPLRGPAVRMWPMLIIVVLLGWTLGRLGCSPLKSYEWILLLLGLTQIPLFAAFCIVAYLFWLSIKSYSLVQQLSRRFYNVNQCVTVALAVPFLLILLYALQTGLLGSPDMRILGEGSSAGKLKWFEARGEGLSLPNTRVISVSIWFYRGLMLLWAVWLAFALIRWAKWGWSQLGMGGYWRQKPKKSAAQSQMDDVSDTGKNV